MQNWTQFCKVRFHQGHIKEAHTCLWSVGLALPCITLLCSLSYLWGEHALGWYWALCPPELSGSVQQLASQFTMCIYICNSRMILSQVEHLAFLVELHEISIGPILEFAKIPLNWSSTLFCIKCLQFNLINKFSEGLFCLISQVTDEDNQPLIYSIHYWLPTGHRATDYWLPSDSGSPDSFLTHLITCSSSLRALLSVGIMKQNSDNKR